MEHYKEKLKMQNLFLGICCGILGLFSVFAAGSELGWFHLLSPLAGDSHWKSGWLGFITGASCGIFAFMFVCLIRNCRALKDDSKLKKLYVKQHDERTIQIQTLARNTAMQILLPLGLVATVIAGYFSITVSITILACIFVFSITSLILMGYYCKKM